MTVENTRKIFRARREDWLDSIALCMAIRDQQGRFHVAQAVTMRSIEPNEYAPDVLVSLTRDEAQALMDELWNVGLRPSEGTGSAGAMAATQKHLDDMQGIAIGLLRQQGVEL